MSAGISAASAALRRAAAECISTWQRAGEHDDVQAWAVTGSAARGDATEASDLELWALTPTSRPALTTCVGELPVTCFFESEALLFDVTYLMTVEAELLLPIVDDSGAFSEIRQFAEQARPKMMAVAREQARRKLLRAKEAKFSSRIDSMDMLQALTDEAEALALLLAIKRGRRCLPKARSFSTVFQQDEGALVAEALGLAEDASLPSYLESKWETLEEYFRVQTGTGFRLPLEATAMMRKATLGDPLDAVWAARAFVERSLLAPTRRRFTSFDVGWNELVASLPANVGDVAMTLLRGPLPVATRQRAVTELSRLIES